METLLWGIELSFTFRIYSSHCSNHWRYILNFLNSISLKNIGRTRIAPYREEYEDFENFLLFYLMRQKFSIKKSFFYSYILAGV